MPLNQAKQALIALAVNELAKDHQYDSITVDMICKQAKISRSGFYRAFQDKYEVLTWCEKFPLERGIGQIGRTLTIAQGVEVAFEGFALFWDMFTSTSRSTERHQRENNGIHRAYELFRETISDYHHLKIDAELDYQAMWAARGTMLAIRERQGLDDDAHELSEHVASCYPARLAEILDNPTDPTERTSLDLRALMLR